jgi:CheY-like chemotaxis protein
MPLRFGDQQPVTRFALPLPRIPTVVVTATAECPFDRQSSCRGRFHIAASRQEPCPCRHSNCYSGDMSKRLKTPDPLKILIVEDNRDARTTMRMLLTMAHGHTVYEASDGTSGVRSALELKPDIALIDLGLPDLDGYEVARRIRAALHGHAITLVALTGYGTPEDRRLTHEAGFDVHLVKPVESAELTKIFEAVARDRP